MLRFGTCQHAWLHICQLSSASYGKSCCIEQYRTFHSLAVILFFNLLILICYLGFIYFFRTYNIWPSFSSLLSLPWHSHALTPLKVSLIIMVICMNKYIIQLILLLFNRFLCMHTQVFVETSHEIKSYFCIFDTSASKINKIIFL